MMYSGARKHIQSGDVLAWDGRCFQCRLVRAFTGETYSHIGVAWVIAERVFILEAVTSGVRIFPLSRELPFYWLPMALEWTPAAEAFALAHVGEKYSRWEAIRAYLQLPQRGKAWQCAKYVLPLLACLGIKLACKVEPGAVIRELQRRGAKLMLVQAD